MNIIVNADDFGRSVSVNSAILMCFEAGVLSRTTIMANMPGFEDACERTHRRGLAERVGVHLTLDDGPPLTERIRQFDAFCDARGQLAFERMQHWRLGASERGALQEEIAAQLQRCRAFRLPVTHCDSHHHAHTELPVFRAIRPVLKEFGMESIRIARNLNRSSLPRRVYKSYITRKMRKSGFRTTDFYGDVPEFEKTEKAKLAGGTCEISVHPGYDEQGSLTDTVHQFPVVQTLRGCLEGEALW